MAGENAENRGETHSDLSGQASDVVQARDISGGIHFHAVSQGSTPVPAQLPADVHGFVNRTADLDRMDAVLGHDIESPGSASLCVVAGTAGVGKTSLAVHWAHRARDRVPDGQLYVNLRGYDPGEPVTAPQALDRFLTALGVAAATIPAEVEDRSALLRTLLANRRVLVVLDNAATVGQVRPLLPGAGRCLVLVTSRSRLSGLLTRDGAHRVTLEVFDELEAVELLKVTVAAYRSGDDENEIAELARLCARLPLALRIAAERAAARPRMPMSELIENLRDESHLWDALSGEDDDDAGAVRTVFAWSYRALPRDAARAFRLLGLHPGPDFSAQAAAAIIAATLGDARRTLDVLVGAHLLGQIGSDRYQFHDLLRAYALDQVRHLDGHGEQQAAFRRGLEWYLHTADNCASKLPGSDPGISQLHLGAPGQGVRPQEFTGPTEASAWFDQERANLLAAVQVAIRHGHDDFAWQIPAALSRAYAETNYFDDWYTTTLLGLEAARRHGDNIAEALLLESLSRASRQSYRLEDAREYAEAARELYHQNGNHHGEVTVLNISALAHIDAHRLGKASELLAEAELLCRDHGYRATLIDVLGNKGYAAKEAGQFQDAYELAQAALDLAVESRDSKQEFEGTCLLAEASLGLGRHEEAARWADRSLAFARAAGIATMEGFVLLDSGAIQCVSGRAAEALVSYQRSASIHRQLGNRNREARAIDGTGEAYRELGHLEAAARFHRQAVAIFRDLGDSWRAAVALDHLAGVVRELGDLNVAAAVWRDAAPLLEGFDDPAALSLRSSIGAVLAKVPPSSTESGQHEV